ncbi:hypothetical protein AQUCO_00201359v1 [Aquilegia coerulea]|uniref:FYVE-type domain-containing protein n=1 Tax=Aquilegia coerulea TaxID=218851 RepID=A0A2G5F7L8_AQUCA|nr:hypothetical protein AQUCO_00201359v1 [Aquilegia coerulea]
MGEDSLASTPSDRRVEQAILALKKGAQLLKYRPRGKPKFCPFRLSTDERHLIWYSGTDEKQLRLDSITKIIPGTVNFQRQPEPGKECQSFSIIYAYGERSLDLVCKDKVQAESWLVGLRALVSRSYLNKPFATLKSWGGAKSCINSPVGYSRRKHNLGLSEDPTKYSQVRSLCGSPPRLLAERYLSDGLSCSSDSFHSSRTRAFSHIQTVRDVVTPHLSSLESDDFEKAERFVSECQTPIRHEVWPANPGLPVVEKTNVLRDVLMWGEGMEGGKLRGGDRICAPNDAQLDALLPKLLESIELLDVKNISFGGKHAALVTRQGEVFCWGEENGGRLGHKINLDLSHPKLVESLNAVHVESVSCGEYHTCAVTYDGELYTWGRVGADVGDLRNKCQWLPHKLSGPFDSIHVSSVACGEWHTAVVASSGQLFTYGDGTFGVLGHGNVQSISQPKEVESLKGLRVKSVACGPWHTAAVVDIMVDRSIGNASSGKLFTWGDGDKGKLGHVDRETKLLPTCVARLVEHDFVQVSCGRMLTVGLTSTGLVCTIGSAIHGQLGNPLAEDKSIAIVEGSLKGEFVKSISSGSYHIAALTSSGRVYTWGKGANGRLGLGDIQDRSSPTLVEALRDRHVESVACGSSFSAAICLHKSILSSDQTACSGCKMVFGFTRKKRNCYNCGFLFCRACSSKKVMNASLAPNKSKPCHVCDMCFNRLTKLTNSPIDYEDKQSLVLANAFPDLKIERGEATLARGSLISPKMSNHEDKKIIGGKTLDKVWKNQQPLDHAFPLSSRPRWGQVQCPVLFSTGTLSKSEPVAEQHLSPGPNNKVPRLTSFLEDFSEPDKMLTEEVQRLQLEAKSLERQCQVKRERLQQYQQRIEQTWSLAKDEAAKCKTAKEIIKALTIKLYTLSEKHSTLNDANIITTQAEGLGLNMYLPEITPICTDASVLDDVDPMLFTARLSAATPNHRQGNEVCALPIPLREPMSNTFTRDQYNVSSRLSDESLVPESCSEQHVAKTLKSDWVVQDEPGVYITFTTMPNGQKGLKRVRFSRKRFSEKEAERWWEENQQRVYEKHDIEGIMNPNKKK